MKDIKTVVEDIQSFYDTYGYPPELLESYELLEQLSASHGTETFLVKRKEGEKLYVAKCFNKSLYTSVGDNKVLKMLRHKGLPNFEEEFQNDTMFCSIREYVNGTPLNQYITEHTMSRKDIVEFCIQLCDILIYLHELDKPVIHRDIKPENIIVKPDRTICLIDFDIARVYHEGAKTDTQFLGTRGFAPPEQYGYSQTDCRTDIFSTGMVLGYLISGETDPVEINRRLGKDRLANIYRKCTAFSPEDRFSSAKKLKEVLLHSDGRGKKFVLLWFGFILSYFVFTGIGFCVGRYTEFFSGPSEHTTAVTFREPMLEQAVRLQLGLLPEEIITEEELLTVTGLYVFGDTLITKTEEELHIGVKRLFEIDQVREGNISSLEDLTKMPNLKQVFLCMQQITDLSPLSELHSLEVVDLKNNPVIDITPLSNLQFLRRISLFDTRVTDLLPLADCPQLTKLDVGRLPIHSLDIFKDFSILEELNLNETTMETLSGIEVLTQLRSLELDGLIDGDLTPLLCLQHLDNVILGEKLREAAAVIGDSTKFTISFR